MAPSKKIRKESATRRVEVRERHAQMLAEGVTPAIAVAKLAAEYDMSPSTIYYYLRDDYNQGERR